MLLTEADVTYDWSQVPESESSSKSDLCPGADASLSELNRKYSDGTSANAKFERSDAGPLIDEVILGNYSSSAFSELKRAIRSCVGKQWTVDEDSGVFDVEMHDESLPKFGDESFAVLLKITGDYGSANVWMVVARVDNLIVRFFFTELTYQAFMGRANSSVRLTKDEVTSIMRAGIDKVRRYS